MSLGAGRLVLLRILSLASCLLLLHCGDCSSNSAPSMGTRVRDGVQQPAAERTYWPIDNLDPLRLEYLPWYTDEYLHGGSIDFHNLYPWSVMLTARDPLEGAKCSAVLLGPRIALTAGHCVCERRKSSAPGEQDWTIIDASDCAKRTYVTTVFHGKIRDELHADMDLQPYVGDVYPHPDLQLVLDEHSNVLTSRADLALIALQAPIRHKLPEVPFGQSEVLEQEPIVMSGFGSDERFDQMLGLRYFRKNKVTRIQSGGRILYEQQGSYLYNGFNGGPCFREEKDGRWLVGIASMGTDKELAFTSTFFYREWIQSEIARILKETKPGPP